VRGCLHPARNSSLSIPPLPPRRHEAARRCGGGGAKAGRGRAGVRDRAVIHLRSAFTSGRSPSPTARRRQEAVRRHRRESGQRRNALRAESTSQTRSLSFDPTASIPHQGHGGAGSAAARTAFGGARVYNLGSFTSTYGRSAHNHAFHESTTSSIRDRLDGTPQKTTSAGKPDDKSAG